MRLQFSWVVIENAGIEEEKKSNIVCHMPHILSDVSVSKLA